MENRKLGVTLTNELGVLLRRNPDALRAPGVAYYSAERAARVGNVTGSPEVPPDLGRKVQQYLAAGVRAVWVVDLEARRITRHAPGEEPRSWTGPEAAVEEPVVPGFACRPGELQGEE